MWGLAGWNIYTPPQPPRRHAAGAGAREARTGVGTRTGTGRTPTRRRWTPTCPRPMFSLKVAYVLSDLSETRPRRDEGHPGQPPVELAAPPGRPDRAEPRPRGRGRDHRQPRRRVHLRPPPVALALAPTCRRSPARCCSSATPTGGSARSTSMPIDNDGAWWANRSPVQRQLLRRGHAHGELLGHQLGRLRRRRDPAAQGAQGARPARPHHPLAALSARVLRMGPRSTSGGPS